ncbi:MAG: hypothetical protein ACPGGB_08705, partial [Flavobacteriales bacterium]
DEAFFVKCDRTTMTQDDIDNGYVTMQFVYPGPVLPDGEYTFCSYIIDIFGNTGDTGCLTVTIDNEDPEPAFENGAEYDTSNTDTYGAYLPGASDPADCEALAAAAGGTWAGVINDAEANMVTPGCYITGGTPFQASTYEWQALATLLPDTTLYLDAAGSASLDLSSADNITATDNIAMDTLFAEPITFDCDDAGTLVPVTVTAIDIAGNINTMTVQVEVLDTVPPTAMAQDVTVYLNDLGEAGLTPEEVDNGSTDACGIATLALDLDAFECEDEGANAVTFTVTDVHGNVSTASATVTVLDTTPPSVTLPDDLEFFLDADGDASLYGEGDIYLRIGEVTEAGDLMETGTAIAGPLLGPLAGDAGPVSLDSLTLQCAAAWAHFTAPEDGVLSLDFDFTNEYTDEWGQVWGDFSALLGGLLGGPVQMSRIRPSWPASCSL